MIDFIMAMLLGIFCGIGIGTIAMGHKVGAPGGSCYGNGTCNVGLVCVDGDGPTCVKMPSGGAK